LTARVLLASLAAWWLQFAGLALTAALLIRATRLAAPRALAALWTAVLLAGVALPAVSALWPVAASPGTGAVIDVAGFTRTAAPQWSPPAPALLGLLAAVAGLRVIRLLRSVGRLRRWADTGRSYEAGDLRTEVAALAGASAELRLCPEVDAPATFGQRRAVVLLPIGFPDEPREKQRHALLHELTHVRRGDWSRALAEELLAEVLWFHPAVRWVAREARVAREQVVDAEVVALTGDRRGYAETLLAMASARARPAPAASLSASSLERRIELLMREGVMSKTKMVLALTSTTLATVFVAAGLARAVPLPTGGGESTGAAGKGAKAAERKVLHKLNPAYPESAKARGIEGDVELDVLVTAAGEVTDVKVVKGPGELIEASVSAVRQWRYAPAGTGTRMTLTLRFMLAKDAPKP
jgi:TonB family protein